MDKDTKDLDLSHEEHIAEEEATKEVSVDEIREKLADDLGIDPDEQSELLDRLVEREQSHREKLFGAIKQKRTWREKAQASTKPKDNPAESNAQTQGMPDIDELVERKLTERLEERELEALSLADELKAEIRDLAKLKGISIREASQLPYIQSRREEIEREARVKEATPRRTNKGSYAPSIDPSKPLNPEDFDFNSEEGVKAWKEAKAAREKHLAKNS